MNSTTLALAVAAIASSIVACTAATESESASLAGADTSGVETACMKGGDFCHPVKSTRSGGMVSSSSSSTGGTVSSSSSSTGGVLGANALAGRGDMYDAVQIDPPVEGPEFPCAGSGPESGAEYRRVSINHELQCWSSVPVVTPAGTIGYGFTALSIFACPYPYTVNRCGPYGNCTCWTY